MRIQAPVRPAASERAAIATVARELMYRANWNADEWISKVDVAGGSRIGAALLKLSGRAVLSDQTLREFVARYAGTDARVGSSERERLLDDVVAITKDLTDPRPPAKWNTNPPTGVLVRWLIGRADVNFDGRVSTADARLGSEWAMSMLGMANGATSLDAWGLERIARLRAPNDDPAVSVKLLASALRSDVAQRIGEAQTVLSLARASISVFDRDQDLRLSVSDGKAAAVTLRLLREPRERANLNDIAAMFSRFDVRSLDGTQQPDGRLDKVEQQAYEAARAAAA